MRNELGIKKWPEIGFHKPHPAVRHYPEARESLQSIVRRKRNMIYIFRNNFLYAVWAMGHGWRPAIPLPEKSSTELYLCPQIFGQVCSLHYCFFFFNLFVHPHLRI